MIDETLPLVTVSVVNRREHWAKRAKRARQHRDIVGLVLRARVVTLRIAEGVDVELTRIAPRELDDDNLRSALKAVRDGVADALGIDDRDRRVAWHYAQRRGSPKEYAVRLRLAPRVVTRSWLLEAGEYTTRRLER